MFGKKIDLNKLSRVRYSIDTELKLLNNKIEQLYSSSKVSKNVLSEIDDINNNLQNNLQYLKLMIEYNDDYIEILDDNDEDKLSDKTEILDIEEFKTEVLDELTKQIQIIDDDKYKTELLDDLTREIEVLDVSNNDEIEQLEYLENTISLSLSSFNKYLDYDNYSKHNEHLERINNDLGKELIEINEKLQQRIKILKIKRFIWTGIFIIFFVSFVIILCVIVNRLFDNYKFNNSINEINKYVVYSDISIDSTLSSEVYDEEDLYIESILSSMYEDGNQSSQSEENKNDDNYHKYIKYNAMSIDFSELRKMNDDLIGWIKVDGTNVNYPFVQSDDNKFYLKHSFDKSSTYMGWIFMDYRNNDFFSDLNTIIYGHGLWNDTMFGSLRKTLEEDWYSNPENHIIKLYTEKGFLLYQVFSNYKIEPESYYISTDFSSNEDYLQFIDTLKERSVYDYDVDISANDRILTLSTCYDDKYRAVIHAKFLYSSFGLQ